MRMLEDLDGKTTVGPQCPARAPSALRLGMPEDLQDSPIPRGRFPCAQAHIQQQTLRLVKSKKQWWYVANRDKPHLSPWPL